MSKNKPIPAAAGEMVKRARAGGIEVTEKLIESYCGLVGRVKLTKPGDPAPFLTIYIGEGRHGSKRRTVAYLESSGRITQRLADRALRVVLRQIKTEQAQRDALDEHELLACDGPDGCGAVYADSMNHTQGDHNARRDAQVRLQYPELPTDAARILHAATSAGIEVNRGPVSFALRHPGEARILVVHGAAHIAQRSQIARDGAVPRALSASAVLYGIEQHALHSRRTAPHINTAELVRRSQEWMPVVSRKRIAEQQRVGRVLRPENAQDSTQWRCRDCGRLAGPDESCGC